MKRAVFGILLASCGLVACGGAKPAGPPPAPAVSVLEAGSEPRRVVRYELPLHTQGRLSSDVETTLTNRYTNTVLENGSNRLAFPAVHTTQHLEVLSVEPDGTITVKLDNERVTSDGEPADPRVARAFERELGRLGRTHETFRLAPSGARSNIHVDTTGEPVRASERTATVQFETQTAMRFPDVPIGVGAAWRVTSLVETAGVQWQRTATYHLRAIDDATASLEFEVTASAPEHALYVEPNATAKVTSGSSIASGQFLVELHGFGVTGGAHETSEVNLSIVNHALRVTSTLQNESSFTVKPADAK